MINTIATSAINIMALVILSRLLFSNNILISSRKRPFCFGIVLTIIVILAEVGTIVASDGGSAWRNLNLVSNVIGFAFTPFIPVVLLCIFDSNFLKTRLYLLLPALINGIAAVLSPFFGLLFSIDSDNRYARGNLFFLFVTVYMIHIVLLIVVSLRNARGHLYSVHWKIFGLTLFVVAGTFIQLVFPSVYSSWHSVTLTIFLYYLLLSEHDGRLDSLTGLYNRSAFEKDKMTLKKRKKYTVIVMDLNDFKKVNDTFGHEYGDAVLIKVASTIRESFDYACSSYRIGGDEFYVLCSGSNPDKINHQLKSMTSRLSGERKHDRCLPTVAYGLSTSQTDMPDIQAMLKAADAEMYEYKQQQKEKLRAAEE
jgi:diguanylate cyclase (GGDEF)-like protein